MITIGYCTKQIDPKFQDYISKSCGIKDVEVIPFENPGTHSLTEAYNIILNKASNDIVVLCHDDIRVKTKKWGQKILDHFSNTDYGIIGVAGTYYYPKSGRWWENSRTMVGCVNHKHPQTNKEFTSKYSCLVGDNIIPVVSIDGLFMVVHKERIKYNFNEDVKGFHFYDVDFSIGNYLKGVKIGCITNVRLLHYSVGQTNEEWEKNRTQFVDRWKDNLPITNEEIGIFYKDYTVNLKKTPKISIIILSKSANELLFSCIDSILNKSNYTNYEIIVGDTGSKDEEIDEFKNKYTQDNIKLVELGSYHFASNNNEIVEKHVSDDTELLLFCNNDIELINDAISHMVNTYNQNKNSVGTIGARLHYEDNTIQHSGIAVYVDKQGHFHLGHIGIKQRYLYHENNLNVVGNTGAFLMINKSLFNVIGMFPTDYEECFEDVHLNLNTLNKNKKNILVGDAVLHHYESKTRNTLEEKNERMQRDLNKIKKIIELNKKSKEYLIRI
jgi:GT2 family glycosyltransferase